MTNWNYRVLHTQDSYHIVEIYYDGDGQPKSWSMSLGILNYWETFESLKRTSYLILEAFYKPVLTLDQKTGSLVEESSATQGDSPAASGETGA